MGRKGTSKRKKAKEKATPAADKNFGSGLLKAINKPEKNKSPGKTSPKADKKH